MRTCVECGAELATIARSHAQTCSAACRKRRSRRRLPAELTGRPRWVRYSATKVPLRADTGAAASSTNPRTWSTYATACRSRHGAGLGVVLDGDGIVCIDLDHCLTGGKVAPWAAAILDRCPPTYIEVSPSGDGLHIWGHGTVRHGRRIPTGTGTAEVYGTGRYITITGRRHGDSPAILADLTEVITHLNV
jgi:primase-polymerase (primpol)-like protein